MRAGTTSWITVCSLWDQAGPPLRCVKSPERACLYQRFAPTEDPRVLQFLFCWL